MYGNTATQSTIIDDLHLPRLLCFHGGGSNARIFKSQCRVLARQLQGKFRLCYVEAPWTSEAGPDVTSVYQDYKPFRRWLRWKHWHPEISASDAVRQIEQAIEDTMRADDREGGSGEWAGLLGFSQGAKMAASILLRQQARAKLFGPNHPAVKTNFRFAILFAGRGPLVSFDPMLLKSPALVNASEIGQPDGSWPRQLNDTKHILQFPTLHVHGMRDQGLTHHRSLLYEYCQTGTTRLVEWDGDHRIPIKTDDVAKVVRQILVISGGIGVTEAPSIASYPSAQAVKGSAAVYSLQTVQA